jgi:2-hydroxychromene-2-carboxylate isomerase
MKVRATWYFDFVSPFAYLQWRRFMELKLEGLMYRPILFAGLLNELGHKGPAEIPAKRIFTYRHVVWRSLRAGIDLKFPRSHPFNPLPALRLCIASGCTTSAIDTVFRHLWEDGLSVETPEEISVLAGRLGLIDATQAVEDPGVKLTLRENFACALADNVFGVPSIVSFGELFWGDDATDMFLEYVRNPSVFCTAEMKRVAQLPIGRARPQIC